MDEQSIFTAAIKIQDEAERDAYLNTACSGDPSLRERVDKLLRNHPHVGTFMAAPARPAVAPTIDQSALSEELGTYIGPYKLHDEIGEGGMGTVYRAVQKEPIRRKVALKVIKAGMDSKQVVSRFENERQALAMMDHPNIARVIDGGTTKSGRPYFVMELVKGIPITDYCDRYRLTTDQRLEVFGDVCSAVQHAHQKGIIHRDLKPSNILVTQLDGKAIPKVIDFGIAKATIGHLTEESLITTHAQMVGTPLYMAPEQADISAADVDTRSDVYSLGVLLYELLTGTTPFDRDRMSSVSFDEFRRIVRKEDPPRPSTRLSTLDAALETVADKHHTDPRTLSNEVSGELDWIVMKSLEKDRTRRYESANELAKDVKRYLDDEPVEACPPTVGYRFKKFARRNKATLVTVSAVALALIVGLAGTSWQSVVATKAKDFAKEQQQIAQQNFESSEKNFQLAFDAVDQMLTEVASEQLKDVPQAEPVRKALLEKALTFYVAFLEERGDDPKVQLEAAKAQRRAGDILKLLGEHERAEKHYREAIASFDELSTEYPNETEHRQAQAESLRALGDILAATGSYVEAENSYYEALDIGRQLNEDHSDKAAFHHLVGAVYYSLGVLQQMTGKLAKAENALRRGLQIEHDWANTTGQVGISQENLATLHTGLANFQHQTGKLEDAEKSYRDSVEIWSGLIEQSPDSPEYRRYLANSYNGLGSVFAATGRYAEAQKSWRESLVIQERLAKDFPHVPSYKSAVAANHLNLGGANEDINNFAEAEQEYRITLKLQEELVKDFPAVPRYRNTLASTYSSIGNVLRKNAKYEEAEEAHREAIKLSEQLVKDFPDIPVFIQSLANWHNNLAIVLTDLRHLEESEQAFRRSWELNGFLVDEYPEVPTYRGNRALSQYNLGIVLNALGRPEEAEQAYCRAQEEYLELVSLNDPLVTSPVFMIRYLNTASHNRGMLLEEAGRLEEARKSFALARDAAEQLCDQAKEVRYYYNWLLDAIRHVRTLDEKICLKASEDSPNDAESHYTLGNVYLKHGKILAAVSAFDRAVLLDPANPTYHMARARGHLDAGNVTDSLSDSQQAMELLPSMAEAHCVHAMALMQLGEKKKAEASWRQAFTLSRNDAAIYADRARSYAEVGDFAKAVTDFTKAIELNEEDALLFAERGFAFAKLGDDEKATADWEKAKQLDPTLAELYSKRGSTATDKARGVHELTKAIQLDPERASFLLSRGRLYFQLTQYNDALSDLDKYIELEPEHENGWRLRGKIHRKLEQDDEAFADFTRAVELKPTVAESHQNLAAIHAERGEFELAFAEYDQLLGGDSPQRSHYAARARVHRQAGNFESALADYQTGIDLDPDNDAQWFKRATAFAERGNIYLDDLRQYEEAVAEYSKAIELSPADWTLLSRRAIARQRVGDQAGSQADLDTLLSHDYDEPLRFHCRLASLYVELDRDEEAMAECLKAIDVTPHDASFATLRAGLLLLADRPDLYRDTCADALKRFGGDETPQTRIYVARCCILAPEAVVDPTQAVSLAKLGVASSPHTQWFLHTLGMAHLRAGQHDEAEQRLRESLEVDPAWHARRQNYLGLALVHHARGDLEQARDWYAKAVAQIDQRPASYTQNLHDWLEAHLLRREVEQVLGPPSNQGTTRKLTERSKAEEEE